MTLKVGRDPYRRTRAARVMLGAVQVYGAQYFDGRRRLVRGTISGYTLAKLSKPEQAVLYRHAVKDPRRCIWRYAFRDRRLRWGR